MRIVRPVLGTLDTMTDRVRDLGRMQEVARVLIRHGLGVLVAGFDLPGVKRPQPVVERWQDTPERVVRAIQELGPTFVKLGQVLSTRPDLLPAPYIEALQKLQDDVSPITFAEVDAQLAAELGEAWRERVQTFDDVPLATASIAVVHRAALVDGQQVVFKIQRPGIQRVIRSDLHIIRLIARRAVVEFPEARSFDPMAVLDEFEESLMAELDFEQEARNMAKVARLFEGCEFVRVPKAIEALSSKTVLCMEFLDGVKMRSAREAGFDMKLVGQRFLTVAYDMLFKHGFFHGDMHPGNVLVLEGEVLGLLDFGMVGRLTREMRNNVISIIFGLERGDHRTIARLFYDIAIKDGRVDYNAVEREAIKLMEEHWSGGSVAEMQLGPFVVDLATAASRHGARVPRDYTMFFKALLTTEGLAKSLIREVDPIAAAAPYIQAFLTERFSEERLQQDAFYNLLTLSSLGRRLPVSMSQLLDDLDHQRLRFTVVDPDRDRTLSLAERLVNRALATGLTITCFVLATHLLDARALFDGDALLVSNLILGLLLLGAGMAFVALSLLSFWRRQ
jgi:ubiquinone biosynthesis protein